MNTHKYPEIDAAIAREGLNDTTFCAAMNIDRSTYYRWQDTGKIPATQLLKMSRILHEKIDILLGNDFSVSDLKSAS